MQKHFLPPLLVRKIWLTRLICSTSCRSYNLDVNFTLLNIGHNCTSSTVRSIFFSIIPHPCKYFYCIKALRKDYWIVKIKYLIPGSHHISVILKYFNSIVVTHNAGIVLKRVLLNKVVLSWELWER